MLDSDKERHPAAVRMADEVDLAEFQSLNELDDVIHFGVDVVVLVRLGIIRQAGAKPIQSENVKVLGKAGDVLRKVVCACVAREAFLGVDQNHGFAGAHLVVAGLDSVDVHEFWP